MKLKVQCMVRLKKIRSMVWLTLAIYWVSASSAQLNLETNDNVQSVQAEQATTEVVSAHQMVEAMTDDLLLLIEAAQRYSADDNQRFFVELDDLLRPVIDFKSFSRAVMGRHASAKKMAMLSSEEQQRLMNQIVRFSNVFSEINFLIFPLAIFSIISGFFGKFIGDRNSEIVTSVLVSISALLSIFVLYQVIANQYEENIVIATWINSGSLNVNWSMLIDPLSAVMLVVVTSISSLVHIYSIGYMSHDPVSYTHLTLPTNREV